MVGTDTVTKGRLWFLKVGSNKIHQEQLYYTLVVKEVKEAEDSAGGEDSEGANGTQAGPGE